MIDIEVSEEYGTVTEEIELICTMTGFRRRFLVHHIGEGFFRSVELGLQRPAWFMRHLAECLINIIVDEF